MLSERLRKWFSDVPQNSIFRDSNSNFDSFCLNSEIGLKRDENQDRTGALYVNSGGAAKNSFYCFALCDGMGGATGGGVAASVAISAFFESLIIQRHISPEERLRSSAAYANAEVEKSLGGGTTLSAVILTSSGIFSINVGDSRIYSKSKEGGVVRHTTDDNLKELGGGKDVGLVQFIGMGNGMRPHIRKIDDPYDMIFLTSDGVHSLDQDVLAKIVEHSPSTSDLCERLVSASVWTGGYDNASAVGVSRSVVEHLSLRSQGAEIAVWNNRAELQIIWSDPKAAAAHPMYKTPVKVDQNKELGKPSDGKVDDTTVIETDELKLEGGRSDRKQSNKKKNSEPRKDIFGDFG